MSGTTRNLIKAPEPNVKRQGFRAILEAITQFEPFSGALARLYQWTYPPKAEKDRDAWQHAVSDRTNENSERLNQHEALISPRATFTGTNARLIEALSRDCPDGMCSKQYTLDDLSALVPDANRQAVEDALFHLESFGLVMVQRFIGPHWFARLDDSFYEHFDGQVMRFDAIGDAKGLAKLVLENSAMGWIPKLHEKSGMEKRQFNPALRYMLRFIDERRISVERQPNYPTMSISVQHEDRAMLRRFLAGDNGHQSP